MFKCVNNSHLLTMMGSRGFEPRIASAPGWYPCPANMPRARDTRFKTKLDDDPATLDEGIETFRLSVLFSFSEYLAVIHICDIFKACLYQVGGFWKCFGYFADMFV